MKNWFLPHPETHKKAYLISIEAFVIYILIFIFIQVGLTVVNGFKPGVLGVNSSIDQKKLIELTNSERQKNGLQPLSENSELDKAAEAKAENMFAENYWAHYAPSGKSPWDFIKGSGYSFSYAGENLARNFYNSDDVVAAWMASPSHRANIVNSHYRDVGMAVVDGVLQGQKTTLVVQEFGTPVEALAQTPQIQAPTTPQPEASVVPANISVQVAGQQIQNGTVVDPYLVTKTYGTGIVALAAILILLDLYILRRRAVHRVSSRHLPHLALLGVAASALMSMHPGGIL